MSDSGRAAEAAPASPSNSSALLCTRASQQIPRRLLPLLALVVFIAGCHKKPPAGADVHAITHELVAAAQRATGGQAEIAIRPERAPAFPGSAAALQDHLYITLRDPARLSALEQALDQVAQRRRLDRGARSNAPGVVRFEYRLAGRLTHSIHIVTPLAELRPPVPARQGGPRLAVIIDDLGYDAAAADNLFALPFPLTVSVLPDLPHSTQIAEEAHRRGYQVLLHLPMESTAGDVPTEAAELRPGMDSPEVAQLLNSMLDTVPGAVGVNNHQGSRATADPHLMAEVMPLLRQRGLFFVDSRTTAQTVAYDAAQRAGVRAAYRNVFLDDSLARPAIRGELGRAERLARKQGWAIAIGHPHPETLKALKQDLPRLEARGIHLVFASDLAR